MLPMARQKGVLALCLLALSTLGLSLSAGAQEATFTTFDPPGSTGTQVNSINPAGVITGYYFEGNNSHGFLRARDGTFTKFDPPGASDTFPASINPAAAITGYYRDASGVAHGFLRVRDGTFKAFDVPGAMFTVATRINPAGRLREAMLTRIMFLTASSALATAPSKRSIFRARSSPLRPASTLRGRLRGSTLTRALCSTDSCALATAPSPLSILRARWTLTPQASTRRGRLWEITMGTRAAWSTASCAATTTTKKKVTKEPRTSSKTLGREVVDGLYCLVCYRWAFDGLGRKRWVTA
jgi:hypothetical protein